MARTCRAVAEARRLLVSSAETDIARSWANRLLHQLGVLVREIVHEADRGCAPEALFRVPVPFGFTEVIANDLAPNIQIGVHVIPLHVGVPEDSELVHSVF